MKVRPSVKPMCEKCRVIKRHGKVMVICENPKQLINDLDYINNSIEVIDENGQKMCYAFDANDYFTQSQIV